MNIFSIKHLQKLFCCAKISPSLIKIKVLLVFERKPKLVQKEENYE